MLQHTRPRCRSRHHAITIAALLAAGLAVTIRVTAQAPAPRGALAPLPPAAPAATFDVFEKTIVDLLAAQRIGTVTSRDLVEKYLARIRAYDQAGPRLNAMIALNPRALDDAAALDAERRSGTVRGPLHGIPIVVKDNYATVGMPTTAGSLALAGFMTGRDAFMVKKLKDAGAVIIGKTNLHELAYGITSISSAGGQTRNPYDPARNPGGSSGGTGAAVAASFAAAGMGTDTCGSIRNPASENNLFGLRGTMGLSSRDGIVPLAHSQDIGGPLARTMTDLLLMLDATVGEDAADAITRTSRNYIPASYGGSVGDAGLGDVTIGVLTPLFGTAPEDVEVARIVRGTFDDFRSLGAGVVDVPFPGLDDLLRDTSVINAEFKFDLLEFLAAYPAPPVRSLADILSSGRYHPAVETVLKRASEVTARETESYRTTLARREAARKAVLEAMDEQGVTAFVYPTLRRKPAPIGEPQGGSNCQLSAATGLPAISMPAGFTDDNLPIGMDLLGGPWSEPTLLKVAYAYERLVAPRRAPKSTPPLGSGQPAAPPASPVALSYEFFKAEVQPIFLKKQPGHARCIACHGQTTTPLDLQPLPKDRTAWTEEESRLNFAAVRRVVIPGSLKSRLLVHALEEQAGGDFYHNGGKHFASQSDPEWQVLRAWVMGQTTK